MGSPKILIGTPEQIVERILERAGRLGLTHYVLRGAPPEQLGAVVDQVRAKAGVGDRAQFVGRRRDIAMERTRP